ncbi:N-6 DNA methylase [candidate division WOR-3 bacterium]|nr:N-6 DNA methylase [candidate division WOR-3 bacterium]
MDKKIEVKEQIKKLVERFEENISQYKKADYDEANTRTDFIDPFFENLGWDVANKQGYAEQYREVVREAEVIIAGKHKAPDYSFRIGGIRKFFVEAKKPAVDLKQQISSAYQLRRYAYTAKLPLSILTDFEEFSVYDTRIKPTPKDLASCARIFYCTYKDYLKNFDFIHNTFSKDGILKGSFDRYVESTKNKKGTSEVDKEFLKLIDKWREKLAKNIALRNKRLSLYELNFAIQKIIDRIIFLRIAEDRQIEDYGKLQNLLNGTNTYKRLREIFLHSDEKYNSGLFDFDKDKITPGISVDDKIIKEILKSVYYPESPYEFSVLGVEILSNIYEQFLGKTIRLTPAHQVKVEEKLEVKKAGGVYYTPKYIVDYIVKNTVGEIIKGKTPKQIDKLKILDPACGSGSFLLGAYQCLLNYHLDWYSKDTNYKKALKKGQIIQTGKDSFQLTIAEKQRILLNNIFGVDIDTQAVEVSKLSLLLKLLEGETEESTRQLFRYTQLKLLPDLSNNIKCGNSLIGPDFYGTQQTTLFDEAEMRRINVFDWKTAFPDIFHNDGFDVVIGNPPYVVVKGGRYTGFEESKLVIDYYKRKYKYVQQQVNIYVAFLELSYNILKKNGFGGMIVPNTLLTNDYCETIRQFFLHNTKILFLNNEGRVFENAVVEGLVIVYKKDIGNGNRITIKFAGQTNHIDQAILSSFYRSRFLIHLTETSTKLISKCLRNTRPLKELCEVWRGLTTGDDKRFITKKKVNEKYKKIVQGKQIHRYYTEDSKLYVHYIVNQLDRARQPRIFEIEEKLISKFVCKNLELSYDNRKLYTLNTTCVIFPLQQTSEKIKYILALLNSKLLNFYFRQVFTDYRDAFPIVKSGHLEQLPIRTIDFTNPSEKAMHDKLVAMVDKMLELQEKFHSAKLESDKKMYKTRIDALDNQINFLVYNLYGLTKKEREIIKKI